MNQGIDKKALFDIGYGMYIVSSCLNDKYNGQIVNTVVQVTADPPRIAVIIHKNNLTHDFIIESGMFAVSGPEQDTPMPFIGLFGFKSGRDVDKLSQVNFKIGETGCPYVTDHALSLIEADVRKMVDVGSHTLFVGKVVAAEVFKGGTPLTYAHYRECKNGRASKNAPTYVPPKAEG